MGMSGTGPVLGMTPVFVALAVGLGVLCWPRIHTPRRASWVLRLPQWLSVAAGGLAASAFGVGTAVATVMAAVTAMLLVARIRRRRRHREVISLAAQVVSTMARQVKAGMQGRAAAAQLASECSHPEIADSLRALAAGRHGQVLCPEVHMLPAAFEVHERHGVRLADLLQAVAADIRSRQDAEQALMVAASGPRFSGYLLALLPFAGLLLGSAMGADPVTVLLSSPAGQVLLPVGVGLTGAGLLWTDAMASRG